MDFCNKEILNMLINIWQVLGKNLIASVYLNFRCTGDEYLESQGIELSPWGLWQNHVALACMIIIFLTIAYVKLLFLKKYS